MSSTGPDIYFWSKVSILFNLDTTTRRERNKVCQEMVDWAKLNGTNQRFYFTILLHDSLEILFYFEDKNDAIWFKLNH